MTIISDRNDIKESLTIIKLVCSSKHNLGISFVFLNVAWNLLINLFFNTKIDINDLAYQNVDANGQEPDKDDKE